MLRAQQHAVMLTGTMMKKIVLTSVAAIGMLFTSMAQAGSQDAQRMPFTLLCKATVSNQLFAKNLEIDYQAKKVDGLHAVITDTMITWSSRDYDQYRQANVVTRHELNRLAGNYRSWTEGAIYSAPPPSYSCEKAPQPKF